MKHSIIYSSSCFGLVMDFGSDLWYGTPRGTTNGGSGSQGCLGVSAGVKMPG